jgi:uracil-DNA glycosylase
VTPDQLVASLARARIGATFNQYREGGRAPLLRERLRRYLEERWDAPLLLVGEAPGFRGARVSGIPFTSERQVTGEGPAESTATIVQRVLAELGIERAVLAWNAVPTHPGDARSNRAPRRAEIAAARPFLEALAAGRTVIPVGRVAEAALGRPGIRHPSRGGAAAFRAGLAYFLSTIEPAQMSVP